ncbi:MAG: hypothetical protein M3Z54_08795 [Gemmatimonadota bacterium]|nr:hypothetical protein [Gemmatimonadota bacterium]
MNKPGPTGNAIERHRHSVKLARIGLLIAAVGLMPAVAAAQIAVGSTVEEHTASSGETYTGVIPVRNVTAVPQPVRVYQEDYTFFADGTSHFDPPGSIARSNAKWVTASGGTITVPPGAELNVAYTIHVPRDSSLAGTYWSTIMVEAAPNLPPHVGEGQIAIGSIMRYAIQLATHIGATGSRKIQFTKQQIITGTNGLPSLEFEVANIGERGYRPLLWMELYDEKGELRGKSQQQRGLIYPGTSVKQSFSLGNPAPGNYKAIVFADTGDDAIFAAQYKLHF